MQVGQQNRAGYDDTSIYALARGVRDRVDALDRNVIRWNQERRHEIPSGGGNPTYISGDAFVVSATSTSGSSNTFTLAADDYPRQGDYLSIRVRPDSLPIILKGLRFGSPTGPTTMTVAPGTLVNIHAASDSRDDITADYWVVHSTPGSGSPGGTIYSDSEVIATTPAGPYTVTQAGATRFFNVTINGIEIYEEAGQWSQAGDTLTIASAAGLAAGDRLGYSWTTGAVVPGGGLADDSVTEAKLAPAVRVKLNSAGGGVDAQDNRPDLLADGMGTEADGYTDADGTAALQTRIDALPRGGVVRLLSSRFNLTKPVSITQPSVRVTGDVAGGNEDPNGEEEGETGTKIHFTSTAFEVGKGDKKDANGNVILESGKNRFFNLELEKMYLWGPGVGVTGSTGVKVKGCVDQPSYRDMNISNVERGFWVSPEAGGGNLDTPYWYRFNVLNSGWGISTETNTLPSFFGHITDCCLSDLSYSCIYLGAGSATNKGDRNHDQNFTGIGNTLVRGAREGGQAVYSRGRGHSYIGNVVRDTGWTFPTDTRPGKRVAADGYLIDSDDTIVSLNQITATANGAGIRVKANRVRIEGNSFGGNLGNIENGRPEVYSDERYFSTNDRDIVIESSAQDTVIAQPGFFTVQDEGARTIINGQSVNNGDPDAGGVWGIIARKPEGLRIYDKAAGIIWEYYSYYQGGRRQVGSAPPATVSPTGAQVEWFRFLDTEQTSSNGKNILTKTSGINAQPRSGAAGRKSVDTPSNAGAPAGELSVSNQNLSEPDNSHYIGFTRPANLGTRTDERILEADYAIYYDGQGGGRYTFFYSRSAGASISNGSVYQGAGTVSIRLYADRTEFCFNGAVVETVNAAPVFPLAPDARISELGGTLYGVALTGQNLINTP